MAETIRPTPDDVIEGRDPDTRGVAAGDLVVGTRIPSQRTVIGVVVHVYPAPRPYFGNRYTVRVADVFPTGDREHCEVYGGVTVLARADGAVNCPLCRQVHIDPTRFVDCLTAHVRASREAEAVAAGGDRYREFVPEFRAPSGE